MGTNRGAVDEHLLQIGVGADRLEQSLPDTAFLPPSEAHVHRVPAPELRGKIAPWGTRAQQPRYRFDEQPVIRCRHAPIARLARQKILDAVSLIIAKHCSNHRSKTINALEQQFKH